MTETVLLVELLLLAILVAIAAKYLRLPYTTALVVAGVAVGLAVHLPELPVAPSLWLLLFLPPLLFEGTINMDLDHLRRYATPVGLVALLGTLISVVLLSAAFHALLGLPLEVAALLGVMLSPTDPVAVLSLFKEQGVARGLQTIVEGESVFNDGVAVVLYIIGLQVVTGHPVSIGEGLIEFVKVVAGGALVGGLLGYLTHRVYSAIDDHLIEVGLSLVLAYGAYLAAERLGVSGVIAVVVAGLIIGNYGRLFSMSPSTRLSLTHFWDVSAFLLNGLLFLLIGLTVERGHLLEFAGQIAVVFLAMMVARAVAVYGTLGVHRIMSRTPIPSSWLHVANWAGLRGSIPVALALSLPLGVPEADRLKAITLGAVLLSLLVQGLTIKPLLRRLGLVQRSAEQETFERAQGGAITARAALRELEALHRQGEIDDRLLQRLSRHFEARHADAISELASTTVDDEAVWRRQVERVSERVFGAQRVALDDALRRGLLSEEVWQELKREVDALLVEGEEVGWERLWHEEHVEVEDADPAAGEQAD